MKSIKLKQIFSRANSKSNKKVLLLSLISSLLLLVLTYLLSNVAIPFSSGETSTLKNYEAIKRDLFHIKRDKNTGWTDSICLINTSFDKVNVPYWEEGTDVMSNCSIPIVNRYHLYQLLKSLDSISSIQYKYILIDLDLSCAQSEYDDLLFDQIAKMDNIVISYSNNNFIPDNRLLESNKYGLVDYFKMPYETGFTKYEFINDTFPSFPYKVYSELSNRQIKSFLGLLFFDKGLCHKANPISYYIIDEDLLPDTISAEMKEQSLVLDKAETMPNSWNLGYFFKNDTIDNMSVTDETNGRIIVIGDFFGGFDLHDTTIGKQSGALINLNAFLSLCKGKHKVNWGSVFLLFILYTILTMYLLKKNTVEQGNIDMVPLFRRLLKSEIFKIIVSFISFTIIFHLIALYQYISSDTFYNAWYPSVWFTFVSRISPLLNLK